MKASYVVKHFTGTIFFFLILFVSAGTIRYLPGLIYVFIGLFMAVLGYTILRPDDDLLKERSGPGEGTRSWDKKILGLTLLITIAMYVTAGLDSGRFHWSPGFHWSLTLAGCILTAAGQLLFLVAQKQNRFFSSTVRIQSDRGHTVCDTGLYSIVRHPAYAGSVIQAAGYPFIMGSVWSIIPSVLMISILIIRTSLEDKTLMDELDGYSAYSRNTRYRIIPFVW